MNKNLKQRIFFVGAAFSSLHAWAETKRIIVTVPWNTPTDNGVYLTGDINELCEWKPQCLRMTEIAPHVFQAQVNYPKKSQGFYFKVTRGSWAKEATDGRGNAVQNSYFDPKASEQVLEVIEWKDQFKPEVQGTLHLHEQFYSPQLGNSRTIRIWLPPSYGTKSPKRYPVIYMHDGQNLFDPKTSSSGKSDWNLDTAMTELIARGEVPEAIIVGVDCTAQRFDEYDWRRLGRQYSNFLIHTVKAWVDANYRTKSDREHTFLMGSSMGAIISYSILWFHPEVFSRAGAASLPTFANYDTILHTVEGSEKPRLPFKILMSHGTHRGDANYRAGCLAFYQMMQSEFQVTSEELHYLIYPYADHFEADWARQMPDFLKFLLN